MAEGEQSFWTTLPGILTGVAAVLTAVGGILAIVLVPGSGSPSPAGPGGATPSDSVTATAGVVPEARSTSAAGSSSPADPTAGSDAADLTGVQTLTVLPGDRLDVDTGMLGTDVDDEDVAYTFASGNLYFRGARAAIVDSWTDRAGCTAALERRSDDVLRKERFGGTAVCVLTSDGALAQIRPSEPAEDGRFVMDVIVWR